ncbi:MAG: hypothetical protein KC731_03585, partial [Myxococcales bacterium]|nr:hypothetical protein [Myxococcales bacterium]
DEVQRTVKFEAVGKSTFRIAYFGESPEEARDVTKWLAEALVEEELGRRREQAVQAMQFLQEEQKRVSEELAQKEERLGEFIAEHPQFATGVQADGRPASAKTQLPAPSPRVPRPRVVRSAPPSSTPAPRATPKAPAPDPKLMAERDAAIAELAQASRKLAELQSKYTDNYPGMDAAKAAVAQAEARVKAANAALEKQARDDIYATIDEPPPPTTSATAAPKTPAPRARPQPVAVAPKPTPEPEPSGEDTPTGELGAIETEWMQLKRSVDEAREQQGRLAVELFRAEVSSRSQTAGHEARVVILDEAYLPANPQRSRLFFVKIGAPLALILALALVLGRALLDDKIYDGDDLQSLGLDPLLSVIPPTHRRNA